MGAPLAAWSGLQSADPDVAEPLPLHQARRAKEHRELRRSLQANAFLTKTRKNDQVLRPALGA
jgi:hypothetical protein